MQKPYTDGTFGRFCWTELMTTNVEAAGKFYCDMFGWTPEHMTNADGGDYFIFKNGENMNCGMMEINPKEMGEMTSHWLNYVAVDSASQTLKRVEDNGGKKVWGTQYMENVGHLAVFIDPHGAAVGIVGEVE